MHSTRTPYLRLWSRSFESRVPFRLPTTAHAAPSLPRRTIWTTSRWSRFMMAAADGPLLEKVHDLSDLELAVLLCLMNREHVLISTPSYAIDQLVRELQLVATKIFGLKWVVVDCDSSTTLEDFASALVFGQQQQQQQKQLQPPATSGSASPYRSRADSYLTTASHGSPRPSTIPSPLASPAHTRTHSQTHMQTQTQTQTPSLPPPPPPQIANFVIAKNLDRAPRIVQIQALELLRTHRIFTRTAVLAAPKQFAFVPVVGAPSGGEARVTSHLNDFFSIAHWHNPEDGFLNLEEGGGGGGGGGGAGEGGGDDNDGTSSTGSVVKKAPMGEATPPPPALISETEISQLAQLSQQVQVDVDVLRYQMNIISFLRMHRAVASGITPTATKHLHQLVRSLAPLHKLDYVTPALVGLAVRKIYLHRIRIAEPEKERSMQWGSNLEAVGALLEGVGPEKVMEDVLQMVTAPL